MPRLFIEETEDGKGLILLGAIQSEGIQGDVQVIIKKGESYLGISGKALLKKMGDFIEMDDLEP